MKKIGYLLYGVLFHIFRLFPVKKNKVVLFMVHNCHFQGNIRYVYEEMKQRNPEDRYLIVSKKELFSKGIRGQLLFYFWLNYHMATAKMICLNDNFLPLAYMNISKKTKVVQLWHGVGAFKRFGLSTEKDPLVRKLVQKGNRHIDILPVSSVNVIPFYQEAMGIKKERIYPVGVPATDFYFNEEKKKQARKRVLKAFPQVKDKKILLYTPTFRSSQEENSKLLSHFNLAKITKELGEEWAIIVRLHPQVHEELTIDCQGCFDATDYEDVKDLYVVANVLVNDYSSTIVEYEILNKPVVLFAYDVEQYDRGFYFDYYDQVPGTMVNNVSELIEEVQKESVDQKKRTHFMELHYDQLDGQAAKRVVDLL